MDETKYVAVREASLASLEQSTLRHVERNSTHVAVKRELLERLMSLADIALWKETAAELRAILESP